MLKHSTPGYLRWAWKISSVSVQTEKYTSIYVPVQMVISNVVSDWSRGGLNQVRILNAATLLPTGDDGSWRVFDKGIRVVWKADCDGHLQRLSGDKVFGTSNDRIWPCLLWRCRPWWVDALLPASFSTAFCCIAMQDTICSLWSLNNVVIGHCSIVCHFGWWEPAGWDVSCLWHLMPRESGTH